MSVNVQYRVYIDGKCGHFSDESQQMLELIKIATQLMIEVNKSYGLPTKDCQQLQTYLLNMDKVCHENLIRLKLVYLFLFNEGIKLIFDYASRMRKDCLLYTSPSPRDKRQSRMPSSA